MSTSSEPGEGGRPASGPGGSGRPASGSGGGASAPPGAEDGVVFVKLGGSLITDKRRPRTARDDAIRDLATATARVLPRLAGGLVLGHGSGSFGHVAAANHRVGETGLDDAERRAGIVETQARAAELHRVVLEALRWAGVPTFSFAPSSAAVAAEGELASIRAEPVLLALSLGLVPVTYGDVVLDRERGGTILSTETVLAALAREIAANHAVRRFVWAGTTPGIYDASGRTIRRVAPGEAEAARRAAGGSGATDVTGGMAHRLETALELARAGIPSWIGDGRDAGRVEEAMLGGEPEGTLVVP